MLREIDKPVLCLCSDTYIINVYILQKSAISWIDLVFTVLGSQAHWDTDCLSVMDQFILM